MNESLHIFQINFMPNIIGEKPGEQIYNFRPGGITYIFHTNKGNRVQNAILIFLCYRLICNDLST